MRKTTLAASIAGLLALLALVAWPGTDAQATAEKQPVAQQPTTGHPGLQGNLARLRAETVRAAANRAAAEARETAREEAAGTVYPGGSSTKAR